MNPAMSNEPSKTAHFQVWMSVEVTARYVRQGSWLFECFQCSQDPESFVEMQVQQQDCEYVPNTDDPVAGSSWSAVVMHAEGTLPSGACDRKHDFLSAADTSDAIHGVRTP